MKFLELIGKVRGKVQTVIAHTVLHTTVVMLNKNVRKHPHEQHKKHDICVVFDFYGFNVLSEHKDGK